jgi:hypothetical protein
MPIVKLFCLSMYEPRPGTFDDVDWMAEMERLYESLSREDQPTAQVIFAFAASPLRHEQ